MNNKSMLFIIISGILFIGCASMGTKTLYKVPESPKINNLGICDLCADTSLTKIFDKTSDIFKETIANTFNNYNISYNFLYYNIDFNNPDTLLIDNICKNKNLDAVLLTQLTFIHVTYSVYFIPVIKNYDTEVEMKLIDRNGSLLYHTLHNTYRGNSYMMPPSAEKTVKDGSLGAIRRLIKELGFD